MRLLDNWLIYYHNDDFGWSLQLPPRFFEVGHVGATPGIKSSWYVEVRLPFGNWHAWERYKDPLTPALLAMKDKKNK